MGWEPRGFDAALSVWEETCSPTSSEMRLVLEWIGELLDDPEDTSTTVYIETTSATRVGCAPGTTVLMRYTLDGDRRRLIAHVIVTVPED